MRPNIIVLISHDTGRFISPYGVDTVNTPNYERLAGESVQFMNAFTTAPQCSPARAALFSGKYPHAVGVMGNVGREHGWRFPDDERHAARIFGDNGYQTWLLGLLHETYLPERLGFDAIELGFPVVDAADHLADLLKTRDSNRPFYCQIGCKETHRPWDGFDCPPDDGRGVTVPPFLEDGPRTREDLAQLQGCVNRLDRGLGQIMDVLERHELVDNTILVVTTDHGIACRRAKCTLYDPGIEVLLFMRWPGHWEPGRSHEFVSHVDILPTLLEAAQINIPQDLQGGAMGRLLSRGQALGRTEIFAEKTWFSFYDPMRCLRTKKYKYIRNFDFCRQTETGLDTVNRGSTIELENRYAGGHPVEELYDLDEDPDEFNNLAVEPTPEHRAVCDKLAGRLLEWMRQTGDPLLAGPVASPFYYRELARLQGEEWTGRYGE